MNNLIQASKFIRLASDYVAPTNTNNEKLWTKHEWETYKKLHPNTEIKPKFVKPKQQSETQSSESTQRPSQSNKNGEMTKFNEIADTIGLKNPEKHYQTTKKIKDEFTKNPNKWKSFKNTLSDWAKNNPQKTQAMKNVGISLVTTALLVAGAAHFPALIPSVYSSGIHAASKILGLATEEEKRSE
jgi:hypothetical protein